MLTAGNCLIFHKYKDLINIMEDMDRYQGERIRRDWFEMCEETLNEKGILYVIVKRDSFVHSRYKPYDVKRFIEVKPKKSNKRW